MLENRDEGRRYELSLVVVLYLKNVKADRKFGICRIEICDFVRSVSRNELQNIFNELAVRVYDGESVASPQVLYRHILQECALARARLPDDVDVMAAVIRLDAELDAARVRGGFPDSQNFRLKKEVYRPLILYSYGNKKIIPPPCKPRVVYTGESGRRTLRPSLSEVARQRILRR
jgi:hypothetical protein